MLRVLYDHHRKAREFPLAINVLPLILGRFIEVATTLLLSMPILAPALLPIGLRPLAVVAPASQESVA